MPLCATAGKRHFRGSTAADNGSPPATEAALAAYPGGVVDRVVQLSNGEYEVHYNGVNWPHHVFVDQDFNVVGAFSPPGACPAMMAPCHDGGEVGRS
jgi:hypothetical protein